MREEVYSSQATGLLPLMSFTLSELYKAYEESGRSNNLLTEEDYNQLGGVIGGLQNRADYIYQAFEKNHPDLFKQYQQVMQNIILRMVYLSTGELAGQRVLEEDLQFTDPAVNTMAAEVLQQLIRSHLVVSGKDNKEKLFYEPAHDVLVKTWGQIWEWIGKIGRDAFFLRSRLAQAVNDWGDNRDPLLLWTRNPWLESLIPLLGAPQANWLNKKETYFVALSKEERDKALDKENQEREEKLLLVQEKYADQQEKNKLIEEKVAEQKTTIKREKKFRTTILVALIGALLLGLLAFFQSRVARENFQQAKVETARSEKLNKDLIIQNARVNSANDSIGKLAKAKTALAGQEQQSREKADSSARVAMQQRQLAYALVEKLNAQIDETIAARRLAESRRDSLDRVALAEKQARLSADSVNTVLQSRNHELDSTNRALNDQKSLNVSQLLTLSKNLEQQDMAKAYRLAELAYSKAPFNAEAKARFNYLTATPAFYYTRRLDGSLYKYTQGGKQLMVYDSVRNMLSLLADSTYAPLGVITISPHLLSAFFSPDGKYLLLAYKNECEIRKINNLADKNNFKLKENNIYSAVYSRSGKILVQTGDGLHLWKSSLGNEMLVKNASFKPGSKIVSAYFSDDDKRIVCNCENGAVYIWDPASDDKKMIAKNAPICAISPAGNYMLAGTATDFSLYDGEGREVKLPEFGKAAQLVSASFSTEGSHVVLSFLNAPTNQPYIQQKAGASNGYTDYYLVGLAAPRKDTMRLNRFFTGNSLFTSYNGTLSLDNGIILDFEENNIVFDKQNGTLELFDVKEHRLKKLVVPGRNQRSISLFHHGNLLLSSGLDNTIRELIYDLPANLEKRGLLPKLTADDMQKFGVEP